MSTMRRLLRVVTFALTLSAAWAAPASPHGRAYRQPDGSETPQLWLKGNQHYSWMVDRNDYTVMKDSNGWWVYAQKEDGDLVPSRFRVGFTNPKKLGLTPHLKTDPKKRPIDNLLQHDDGALKDHRELLKVPTSALCNFNGTKDSPCRLKGLVMLIQFSDHSERNLPDPEDYDILFNNNGPTSDGIAPTGSVSDVFMANSYDSFVLESVISPWIKVNRTELQTVSTNKGLNTYDTRLTWNEALWRLEHMGVDLTAFDSDGDGVIDCLVLLHSGVASEANGDDCETGRSFTQRIWSHATEQTWYQSPYSGVINKRFYVASAIWDVCPSGGANSKWGLARIAVIAHECAHFLGLPDLYNADGNGGAGGFDMAGNMWGWTGSQLCPPLMCAWSKMKMQWVNVVHITEPGIYELEESSVSNTIYRIDRNMPEGEYFLVENRFDTGFDVDLRHFSSKRFKDRMGAALWHIDETGVLGKDASNRDVIDYRTQSFPGDGIFPAVHYKVALVQADGRFQLEQSKNRGEQLDLFRRNSLNLISAYKITPTGLVLNNGTAIVSAANTNSYAYGYERCTGISLEFGAVAPKMTMIYSFDDSACPEGSFPEEATTSSPTPAPTPKPTIAPTPLPTPRPTEPPVPLATPPPTPRPTVAPTPRPTVAPTPRPTEAPTPRPTMPPTPRPTVSPTPRPTEPPVPLATPPPTPRPTKAPTPRPTVAPTPAPTLSTARTSDNVPQPTAYDCSQHDGSRKHCRGRRGSPVRQACRWLWKTQKCEPR